MSEDKFAYSIAEFCKAHGISRATFYNLARDGLAPKTIKLNRRRLIAAEAALEWRKGMESRSSGIPS